MNTKTLTTMLCAAGFACAAMAQAANENAKEEKDGLAYTPGEGISYGEQQLVSAEVGVAFDSRYMTYGVVDGKDPIITPSAKVTFLDWLYLSTEAIYDVTKGNGKRGGYGQRPGKRSTLDMIFGLAHDFEISEKFGTLSVDANYIYEYFRRYHDEGDRCMDDTQYVNLELGLSDGIFWGEPTLAIERDIMADNGTYVNLELGHTFALIGDDDDPTLTFRPSVGQGFGNTVRVRTYDFYTKGGEPLDHGGLMDTSIKGEFEWAICDFASLSAYVAYYDYLFDANMREGARSHNAAWGNASRYRYSHNFVCGMALTLTF